MLSGVFQRIIGFPSREAIHCSRNSDSHFEMIRVPPYRFSRAHSAALGACLQHTLEPDQTTRHTVTVQTLKPTGTIAKQVDISIYDNNTASAPQLFAGNTGDSGLVRALLDIPISGKIYSLRAKKLDPLGGVLFARTYYPLGLACADTVVQVIVPEAETGAETGSRVDSLCGTDVDRTLTFYACSDSSVSINYTIKNCSASAMTITSGAVNAPFSISPTNAQIAPNGTATFTLAYSGVGQTSDDRHK